MDQTKRALEVLDNVKEIVSDGLKDEKPKWTEEVLVTVEDVVNGYSAFLDLGIVPDAEFTATVKRIVETQIVTLEDQQIIARCTLAEVAKQINPALKTWEFQVSSIECAHSLAMANKHS